jgi:hypothetical protein
MGNKIDIRQPLTETVEVSRFVHLEEILFLSLRPNENVYIGRALGRREELSIRMTP